MEENMMQFGHVQISINKDNEQPQIKTQNIFLNDECRLSNILVLSTKRSGKKEYLIPSMFKQDLERKDSGITFVASRSEQAYNLYAMAKLAKRKVHILKPSANFHVLNQLVFSNIWNRQSIQENIIDYKQAIRDKDVIIIDMEYENYSYLAVRAVAMLLMMLQSDMNETSVTLRRKHFVYIDDAFRYIDYIGNLLEFGSDYNISTTLFFQSRSQFKTQRKDYTSLIDNNVRNTIILQGMNYNDAIYYSKRLNLSSKQRPDDLMARDYGSFLFEILAPDSFKVNKGCAKLLSLKEDEKEKIYKAAAKYRKTLHKELNKASEDKSFRLLNEQEALNILNDHLQLTNAPSSTYLESIADVITEDAKKDFPEENKKISKENQDDTKDKPLEQEEVTLDFDPKEMNFDINKLPLNTEEVSLENQSINNDQELSEEISLEFDKKEEVKDIVITEDSEPTKNERKFLIGGTIDTSYGQGIKSAKPIRVAQDYIKGMIKDKEFGDLF